MYNKRWYALQKRKTAGLPADTPSQGLSQVGKEIRAQGASAQTEAAKKAQAVMGEVNPLQQPHVTPLVPIEPTTLSGTSFWVLVVREGFIPSWEGPFPSEEMARNAVTSLNERLREPDPPEELRGVTSLTAFRVEVKAIPLESYVQHRRPLGFRLPGGRVNDKNRHTGQDTGEGGGEEGLPADTTPSG